jgi:hypothetical protein
MTNRIGVRTLWDAYRNFGQLKRDALLFDTVAVIDSSNASALPCPSASDEDNRSMQADFDWLLDQRIVEDPLRIRFTEDEEVEGLQESLKINSAMDDRDVRFFTAAYNRRPSTNACWLLPSLPKKGAGKVTDVLRIVLNSFPIPNDDVAWDRIAEFRLDSDSRVKRSRLIDWINETARKDLSALEIEEKLEALLNEYSEHMKRHQVDYRRGSFAVVAITVAEIAEDLVKVKWSKLAKALFDIGHESAELRDAEAKAPGRELAYIDAANQEFAR